MKKINIFSRKICNNKKINRMITHWVRLLGYKPEDFEGFLELAKVATPVEYDCACKFEYPYHQFVCNTADFKRIRVGLDSGVMLDMPTLQINGCGETRTYEIYPKSYSTNGHPEVSSTKICIETVGRIFESYYDEKYLTITLIIEEIHVLNIKIRKISYFPWNEIENEIISCVTSLDENTPINEVYGKIISIIEPKLEDFKNVCEIYISRLIKDGENEKKLGNITMFYGKFQEYTLQENDEFYYVPKKGAWSYYSPKLEYDFEPSNEICKILISPSTKEEYFELISSKKIKQIEEKFSYIKENFLN